MTMMMSDARARQPVACPAMLFLDARQRTMTALDNPGCASTADEVRRLRYGQTIPDERRPAFPTLPRLTSGADRRLRALACWC